MEQESGRGALVFSVRSNDCNKSIGTGADHLVGLIPCIAQSEIYHCLVDCLGIMVYGSAMFLNTLLAINPPPITLLSQPGCVLFFPSGLLRPYLATIAAGCKAGR